MAAGGKNDGIHAQLRRNAVALISLVVALTSLGYNTWRNEQTEANRNVRTAGFALIGELAALQRTVFAIRYRGAALEPAVQEGWVHVLTIRDLCHAMPASVQSQADGLLGAWQEHARDANQEAHYQRIDGAIDDLRDGILEALRSLD